MKPAAVQTPGAPDPALEALKKAGAPGSEYKISSHLLLEAFDRERAGLEILHRDLFDSALPVVLSALAVLGRLRDPRSPRLIFQLLNRQDEGIQVAAVQALGAMGQASAQRVLLDLQKFTKSDRLRCAILESLTALAPREAAVPALLRDSATSPLASAQCRARGAALQVRLEGEPAAELLLESGRAEIVEAVLGEALQTGQGSAAGLRHGLAHYHRLSKASRKLLVGLAGTAAHSASGSLLLAGLADVDPEIRSAAYRVLGTSPAQLDHYPALLLCLSAQVDPVLGLEEEALAAIDRLESALGGTRLPQLDLSQRVQAQLQELFKALSARQRQVTSDSHELGWLISRSREYLEFYADEEMRQALLNYLKGGGYFNANRLLTMLKASAVKVEVRHFDGYKALADIIQNPKRPGIALLARELAIAKLGRRETFYRLIRNLRLTRLVAASPEAGTLFHQIYQWAKEARLYRLAEAALQALVRGYRARATGLGQECLVPPVFSKLCAIAAIRLLKELDWGRLEPAVLRLLGATEEANILLNLVEALSSWKLPLGGELVKALVSLLASGQNREVSSRVVELLSSQRDANILSSVTAGFERSEPWRQELVLVLIERRLAENGIFNPEGLSEFLYSVLRSGGERLQARAAVLLWRLGDEYALKLLRDLLRSRDSALQTEVVRALQGAAIARLVPALQPLFCQENASLQEALRATLLGASAEPEAQAKILAAVLAARGLTGAAEETQQEGEAEEPVDFGRERKAFRFEREHIQELAILFTDIQGYSRKAQALSSLQLSTLLQEYEGILLPTFEAHRGELIKKMGDGHMFVFQQPLEATLAAIRLQKALKRFNSYREEALRLVVRIGLHWGKVVCREGDVLGNHVNIASRLESSAQGGSILVSDAVYQRLQGHIHVREIGLIEVKNISEPIKAYEPYEIALDLPAGLDPLKSGQAGRKPDDGHGKGGGSSRTLTLDGSAVDYLVETFTTLNSLCQQAEGRRIPVSAIRQELSSRWRKLRDVLSGRQAGRQRK